MREADRLPGGARRDSFGVGPWAAFPLLIAMSLAAFSGDLERFTTSAGDAELVPTYSWAEIALRPTEVLRSREVARYAERFAIGHELAELIYDAALAEGLEPNLAFPLVKVESSFRPRAVSTAGAVGYTQVRPSTARWLDPTLTRERLFEPETNLRIGFRYLRMMLDRYDDDERLALLAYNRGPGTVAALLAVGEDPSNGYASRVLRAAHGMERAAD